VSRHDEPTNNVPLSSAEIAGFMNWRGPGAYTAHAERRVVRLIDEAVRREREACARTLLIATRRPAAQTPSCTMF